MRTVPVPTRLLNDRRAGVDRRATPRRHALLPVPADRRQVVDPRSGRERRSTLDRRCRPSSGGVETPSEHLRNALQLLASLTELPEDQRLVIDFATGRLRSALAFLERRSD